MELVYIVILNYNSWIDTISCVNSICDSTYKNFKIIIIDNKSTDNSVIELENWIKDFNLNIHNEFIFQASDFRIENVKSIITLIKSDSNNGFAAGNNIFLSKLDNRNDIVWLLNPDTIIAPDCLENMVKEIKNNFNTILGAKIYSFSNKEKLLSIGGSKVIFPLGIVREIKSTLNTNEVDYIHGGCLMTYAQNFKSIGLLPENYFLYWEETDWCYKAKQLNFNLVCAKDAMIYDKVGGVIGRGYFSDYFYTLNALKFISKYKGNFFVLMPLFFNLFRFFYKTLFKFEFKRAKAVLFGSLDFVLKTNFFIPKSKL